jgi:flagellin-like hook-associated protein FlgL
MLPSKDYHQIGTIAAPPITGNATIASLGIANNSQFNLTVGSTVKTFTTSANMTMNELLGQINTAFSGQLKASLINGNLDLLGVDPSLPISISNVGGGDFATEITFTADLSPTINTKELLDSLNAVPDITAEIDSGGKLKITSPRGDDIVITDIYNSAQTREGLAAKALGILGSATNGSAVRREYSKQYDMVLAQIDQFVMNNDASYRGVNLINGQSLTVNFNEERTSQLTITGVVLDTNGLSLKEADNEWLTRADIERSLAQIDIAAARLKTQASELSQNLSSIQNRQTFAENMINVLTAGADALVLADMNEESANLLALQLRQQLGTNSLALASQAAQSVLSLFN